MNINELWEMISDEHSRIMEEYEDGTADGYNRDERNFDDGYVSALDWVMEIMRKSEQ